MNVKEILKNSGIPPGKIYSVLKSLSKRGIITQSNSRPKNFYVENPAKIPANTNAITHWEEGFANPLNLFL